ncbi:MAG TPA: thrombospondin type 3 repeat-containing protein [Polyangium sp.]|jgi:hypothetical protein|nr:thrombospondin type 3 repeat-containing protein [Polyangium sp.]
MRLHLATTLLTGLLMSCGNGGLVAAVPHFDPPSATTLPEVGSLVKVINLDNEPVICYTTDGSPAVFSSDCMNKLDATRQIAIPKCGFNVVRIAWSKGTDEANYVVESEACKSSCDPVVPWSNGELVKAATVWLDEVRCLMNGCQNPSGTGNWSANCDSGKVAWDVSLDGLRAISTQTYTDCAHAVNIEVEENGMTVMKKINLVVNGKIIQDTDFSGNGNEGGTMTITGDYTGTVVSHSVIKDKKRGGGSYDASCSADPFDTKDCAPAEAKISYDFPDWSCHGNICPVAAMGACTSADTDKDAIPDSSDNCPDIANTDQADTDKDGIGNACDDKSDFVVLRFKISDRCLTLADGQVESTTTCEPLDPMQQWQMSTDGTAFTFVNVSNGECLSQKGILAGPWTLITAPCDGSDKQRWLLEKYDQGGFDTNFPVRFHNVAENFCAYTDFTGNVYGTISNCGLAGTENNRKVGIYYGGAFDTQPYQPQ